MYIRKYISFKVLNPWDCISDIAKKKIKEANWRTEAPFLHFADKEIKKKMRDHFLILHISGLQTSSSLVTPPNSDHQEFKNSICFLTAAINVIIFFFLTNKTFRQIIRNFCKICSFLSSSTSNYHGLILTMRGQEIPDY